MARIIQTVLGAKLRNSRAWRQLSEDFRQLTSLALTLHGPLGEEWQGCSCAAKSPLCAALQRQRNGQIHCRRVIQTLLEESDTHSMAAVCDASLTELAVPIRVAGHTIAYLVTGGFFDETGGPSINRSRHLLSRCGIAISDAELTEHLDVVRRLDPSYREAVRRWLESAAFQLAETLRSEGHGEPVEGPRSGMPASIRRATDWIQGHCSEAISLEQAASVAGLSKGHFCRLFHQTTGLGFSEYLAHERLRRATGLLRQTRMPISEIAFHCGFQSISQFNRRFRKGIGMSPRTFRQQAPATGEHFALQ